VSSTSCRLPLPIRALPDHQDVVDALCKWLEHKRHSNMPYKSHREKSGMFCKCNFGVFLEDLRHQFLIIIIFSDCSCILGTEQYREFEHTQIVSGEKSRLTAEKSGVNGEKSGMNGEKSGIWRKIR
jgi:hypothetical protein